MSAPEFEPHLANLKTVAFAAAKPRRLCTDCGISRTATPADCAAACQFIKPDYAAAEVRVHGRSRDPSRPDELHFGPFLAMHQARMRTPRSAAQWTGITTSLCQRLLDDGAVDAVLTVAPDANDRWRPVPVLVTRGEDLVQCRGMRMGYAPLLALLEPALQAGYRRLAVVGIPCQVYALRQIETQLDLDALYVIGTPCSDNTSTANFHAFLALLSDAPETITYLEFRADYRVELRFADGSVKLIPFLDLPISSLPDDFFPLTCRTCVDYTNVLADITVGYMGGAGEQWLLVRNERGRALLDALGDDIVLQTPKTGGKRQRSVQGFLANTQRAAGGLPLRRMPAWLRPLVSWLMPKVGPKGLEFARARVEMKAIESVLHLRRQMPRRLRHMLPAHIWKLVARYGLRARESERPPGTAN